MSDATKQRSAASTLTDQIGRFNKAVAAARKAGVNVELSIHRLNGEIEAPKFRTPFNPRADVAKNEALARRVREAATEVNRLRGIAKREGLEVNLRATSDGLATPVEILARL